MTEVHVAHTSDLGQDALTAARRLLDGVFDDMTDQDWEHALGGMHALVWEGAAIVGHASLIQRRLLHHGRALRTGYLEAMAVRADRRRRGHGAAMMAALELIAHRAYDVAALGATDEAASFYASRGWRPWPGPLSALTPAGIRPTPEEAGGVFVLPLGAPLDLAGELTCDWRDGDVW